MKIKRFISFILAAVMILSLCSVSAFAASPETDQDYTSSDDNPFAIVIYDADGNIVETHYLPRTLYVNGDQFTIPAGGTLRTYQYGAAIAFYAGFYFVHSDHSGYATTRNRSVTVYLRSASSVGGDRTVVDYGTFSTNEENNIGNANYEAGIQAGCSAVRLEWMVKDSSLYYDALYKNNSSSSMTIALLVGRD